MDSNDQEAIHEQGYVAGARAAWTSILEEACRQLGYDETATRMSWVSERERAVQALRELCRMHGDNDWHEHLHLADIIDKHLDWE